MFRYDPPTRYLAVCLLLTGRQLTSFWLATGRLQHCPNVSGVPNPVRHEICAMVCVLI
jgi:hypothetical protein